MGCTGDHHPINPAEQGTDVGDTMSVILGPCGPDCTTFLSSAKSGCPRELHPQGNTWTRPVSNMHIGAECTGTLDDGTLAPVLD